MTSTSSSTMMTACAPAKIAAPPNPCTTERAKDASGGKAIVICMRSWNYAHRKRAQEDEPTPWQCEKAGNKAYLNAVPPLSGHQNICDFIACINYASMAGIVTHKEATHYLANARVALAALSLLAKPQATGAKSGGKPEAAPAQDEEE